MTKKQRKALALAAEAVDSALSQDAALSEANATIINLEAEIRKLKIENERLQSGGSAVKTLCGIRDRAITLGRAAVWARDAFGDASVQRKAIERGARLQLVDEPGYGSSYPRAVPEEFGKRLAKLFEAVDRWMDHQNNLYPEQNVD